MDGREDDNPDKAWTAEQDEEFKSHFEGLLDTVHDGLGDKQIVTITNFKLN